MRGSSRVRYPPGYAEEGRRRKKKKKKKKKKMGNAKNCNHK